MTHEHFLVEEETPELRTPIMVAAFRGWNDAGDAATYAAAHLARAWSARRFASVDPEEFYDFQAVRPEVELVGGETRKITWPANELSAASPNGSEHDVIVLVGTEPNMKWRTFSDMIVEVAKRYDVRLMITFGALLADVSHARPVPITGTAVDSALIQKLNLTRSRYEGPTGIVGVLHEAFARASIPSASLWAAVPHYLAVSPNPKAALALVERATELIGVSVEIDELARASQVYEERVSEMVATDEDVQAYVRQLEERADDRENEDEIPSGEDLAQELERYLRERGQN